MRKLSRDDARNLGKTHQIGHGSHRELLHHAPTMNLDRLLRRFQFRGYLLVQEADDYEAQHLEFSRRQFIDQTARSASLRALAQAFPASDNAFLAAAISSSPSNGFKRKSTAPFFMACLHAGTSL